MVGLILCAGRSTRLKEETKDKPKCMVLVGGKPILERIANHLEKHGIEKIIVNLSSYPETVMKHFGQRFLYLYEPIPTGRMATVSLVRAWFPNEDILCVNGDTLTDFFPNDEVGSKEKVSNGYTYYKNGVELNYYADNFIDIGTPSGLKKAREYYDRNKET